MFIGGAFSSRPGRPVPGRCGCAAGADAGGPRRRLPGRAPTTRSSGSRAAPRCSTGSGASSPTNPDIFGQQDDPRPGGLFDVIAGDGARTARIKATVDPRGAAHPSRPDLARPHHARRRRSRRHLAPSRSSQAPDADDGPRALPQAVAMALLFADRAAANGRATRSSRSTASPACRNTATAGSSSIPACSP